MWHIIGPNPWWICNGHQYTPYPRFRFLPILPTFWRLSQTIWEAERPTLLVLRPKNRIRRQWRFQTSGPTSTFSEVFLMIVKSLQTAQMNETVVLNSRVQIWSRCLQLYPSQLQSMSKTFKNQHETTISNTYIHQLKLSCSHNPLPRVSLRRGHQHCFSRSLESCSSSCSEEMRWLCGIVFSFCWQAWASFFHQSV